MPDTQLSDQSTSPSSPDLPPLGELTELEDGSERVAPVIFYVYVHMKPDLTPFYVGKGSLSRAKNLTRGNRNKWHERVVAKYGKESIIVETFACRTEQEAFFREKTTILALKCSGVKLCNLTDGGEGSSGFRLVGDRKNRLMEGHRRYRENVENMVAISERFKGRKLSALWKEKLSIAAKNRMLDKNQRKNLSDKCSGFKHSPDAIAKIKAAAQQQASDPDIQAKKSKTMMGRKHSEETKQKIRESHLARRKGNINGQ